MLVLWLVLLLLIAVQAPIFPHVVHCVLKLEAWRNGITVSIGKVEGSLFDPVVLRDSVWRYRTISGTTTTVQIKRARASLAWSKFLPESAGRWIGRGSAPPGNGGAFFQRLELSGVSGKLSIPADGPDSAEPRPVRKLRSSPSPDWLGTPAIVSVRDADIALERNSDWVRAKGVRFTLDRVERGTVHAAQIAWNIQGVTQTFNGVRGRSTLAESRASFSGLALGPEVKVRTFSVGLAELAAGKLSFAAEFDAFGGTLAASAETASRGRQLRMDVTGTFDKIRIAGMGKFFGRDEAAGGVLTKGGFTFRGSPRDFTRAEANVRFDADNFQWDNRQFDRLTLGISLMNQRLRVHEFKLLQGENVLDLEGTMALPQHGVPSWKRQFDLKVNADLRDLTGLAALVLPEFKFVGGQLFARGAVSCTGFVNDKPPVYGGQLILSGSGIKWRNALLDVMNAALVLHEREVQVINAQFLHGDDFLRGVGKISLVGDGAYEGVVRISTGNLAAYQALLGPPVMPFSPAGRAAVEWRGSGKTRNHEGKFFARLAAFGVAGSKRTKSSHPLDAVIEGGYAGGQVQFDKCELNAGDTALTGTLAIGPSAVNLRGIQITQEGTVRLEGDALLPLSLWRQWPGMEIGGLLNDDTVTRVSITANNLDLRKAGLLTGVEWPLGGTVTGTVSAEGALKALQLGGTLSLQNGRIPLNRNGASVSNVNAEFSIAGPAIQLAKAAGRHASGAFTLEGTLNLASPRIPVLAVSGVGTSTGRPFSFRLDGPTTNPVLTSEGPAPFSEKKPASPPPK